jgi:hypothetical protein
MSREREPTGSLKEAHLLEVEEFWPTEGEKDANV